MVVGAAQQLLPVTAVPVLGTAGEQRQNALGWRQIAVSWEEFDV